MAAVISAFDPLLFSNKLIKAGLPKPQADEIAEIQKEVFVIHNQMVEEKVNTICATKEDLFKVEASLREDIRRLDGNMHQLETSLRKDIQRLEGNMHQVETSLREDIRHLEKSLRDEMSTQKSMLKGLMAFMVIFVTPIFIKIFFG